MPRKFVFLGLGDSDLLSPTGLDFRWDTESFDVSVGELGHDSLLKEESSPCSPVISGRGIGTDLQRLCFSESCRPFLPDAASGELFLVPEAGWD